MERLILIGKGDDKYKRMCALLGEEAVEADDETSRTRHFIELRYTLRDRLGACLKDGFWADWSLPDDQLVIIEGPTRSWVWSNLQTPEIQEAIAGLWEKLETRSVSPVSSPEAGKECLVGKYHLDQFSETEHVLLRMIASGHIETPWEFTSVHLGLFQFHFPYHVYDTSVWYTVVKEV